MNQIVEQANNEVGDCRLLREVGRGQMGIVYEAEQISMKRGLAVKILPLKLAKEPTFVEAFKEEARVTATFHHENIVPAYAVGCERGVHYIVMKFIDGRSVNNFITEPPIKDSTFRLLAQLFFLAANALEHAHELGVVHRDIEPGNLLNNSSRAA
jgi:serine/threonine protein kinase